MEQLKKTKKNIQMTNLIKKIIWLFCRNKTINKSINKHEKVFENLGDNMDYDGMGNYGRFPPERK